MSDQKFTSNRAIKIIIGICIGVALIITLGIMLNNRNFNNDRVYGEFTGQIYFSDQSNSNFTANFDGKGNFDGNMTLDDNLVTFTKEDYLCQENVVAFDLYFEDAQLFLSFNGTISADNTVIQGEVRYYYPSTLEPMFGTFLISKNS